MSKSGVNIVGYQIHKLRQEIQEARNLIDRLIAGEGGLAKSSDLDAVVLSVASNAGTISTLSSAYSSHKHDSISDVDSSTKIQVLGNDVINTTINNNVVSVMEASKVTMVQDIKLNKTFGLIEFGTHFALQDHTGDDMFNIGTWNGSALEPYICVQNSSNTRNRELRFL